jgi:hypothetical protein
MLMYPLIDNKIVSKYNDYPVNTMIIQDYSLSMASLCLVVVFEKVKDFIVH